MTLYMMNKIKYLLIALAVVFLSSCVKGSDTVTAIVAEWHLVEMTGVQADDLPSVYIDFKADLTFEIYQKVGEGRYRRYDGTYVVTEDVVTGKYSDGEDWGSGYAVSFDGDDEILVLTADNGSGEVCKYEKLSLDQAEKEKADVVTKAHESLPRFL